MDQGSQKHPFLTKGVFLPKVDFSIITLIDPKRLARLEQFTFSVHKHFHVIGYTDKSQHQLRQFERLDQLGHGFMRVFRD